MRRRVRDIGQPRQTRENRQRQTRVGPLSTLNPFSGARRRRVAEQIREEREGPYEYDSNRVAVRWITLVMGVWIVLAILAVFTEYSQARVLRRWRDAGFDTVPPAVSTQQDLDQLVRFAAQNPAVECNSIEDVVARTPGCETVIALSGDLRSSEDSGGLVFAGLALAFIIGAILTSSFAYQASRNLLTLKSEGQRFGPTGAALWLFVPFANYFRGSQIFSELWRGSEPSASTFDRTAWRNSPRSALVPLWWLSFAVATTLGPWIMRRLVASEGIQDRINAAPIVALSDLLLIAPAVLAVIVIRGIHLRQERRFEIVGRHVVRPPGAKSGGELEGSGRPDDC